MIHLSIIVLYIYSLYLNTNLYDYISIHTCDYQIIMTFTPACAVVRCVRYRMWGIIYLRLFARQLFSNEQDMSDHTPLLCLPVRLCSDRLSLIEECIAHCSTAYKQSTTLLSLASLLRVAGIAASSQHSCIFLLLFG